MAPEEESVTAQDTEKESLQKLQNYVVELEQRFEQAKADRELHNPRTIKYPDEEFFSSLDSSFKKNTAFVKKIRNMSEVQKDAILKELSSLNLSRYISEIASALVETKFKFTDLPLCIKVCSFLHLRYQEFSNHLLEAWIKYFPKKSSDSYNSSKLRTDIRFYVELFLSGIFSSKESLQTLFALLSFLINHDKESSKNLNVLCVFVKYYGPEFLGLIPGEMMKLSDQFKHIPMPVCDFISPERQKILVNLFSDYFNSIVRTVKKNHANLKYLDRENQKALALRGEVNKDKKTKFDALNTEFQKLLQFVQQLADLMNEDIPEFDDPTSTDVEEKGVNFEFGNSFQSDAKGLNLDIWDDPETKNFYENLPDLKSIIPSILYKDSQEDETIPVVETENEKDFEEAKEEEEDKDIENLNENDELEIALSAMNIKVDEETEDGTKKTASSATKAQLTQFFDSLSTRQNRDIIDKAALTFATTFNTKANRKKLVNILFTVKRTRLDLLPYYARFVAQLNPIMPGVTAELIAILKSNFRYLFRKKDQIIIESKIKCVRFIGELVNFRLYSKADALFILKTLLSDFKYHHIDMACNFLETCGKFLFRSADSHIATKQLLDQMARLKSRMTFDSRYAIMIQNVCCIVYPPDNRPITQEEVKPPMHQYIDKLLYKDLAAGVNITPKMRCLNWNDPEVREYALRKFTSPWNLEISDLKNFVKFLKTFYSYQPTVVIAVLDYVLEDIRINLEMDNFGYNQRRLAMINLFSECFLARLYDVNVVFQVLYLLITFGINYDDLTKSTMDFSTSLMRIRMVAKILSSCGAILLKIARKPFDYFLLFYQRYFWFKKSYLMSLPSDMIGVDTLFYIDAIFREIQHHKPKFQFVKSYDDAVKKLESSLKEVTNKTNAVLTNEKVTVEQFVYPHREIERNPQSNNLDSIDEDCEDGQSEVEDDDDDEYDEDDDDDTNQLDSDGTDDCQEELEDELELLDQNSVHKKAVLMSCTEDDEFMREFDQMMTDTWSARANEIVNTKSEIVIPIERNEPNKKKMNSMEACQARESGDPISLALPNESVDQKETVTFRVMSKNVRSNKPVLRAIEVAPESELARNFKVREEEIKAEKEAFKKVILDMTQRREMEDNNSVSEGRNSLSTMIRQTPTTANDGNGTGVNYHQFRRRYN